MIGIVKLAASFLVLLAVASLVQFTCANIFNDELDEETRSHIINLVDDIIKNDGDPIEVLEVGLAQLKSEKSKRSLDENSDAFWDIDDDSYDEIFSSGAFPPLPSSSGLVSDIQTPGAVITSSGARSIDDKQAAPSLAQETNEHPVEPVNDPAPQAPAPQELAPKSDIESNVQAQQAPKETPPPAEAQPPVDQTQPTPKPAETTTIAPTEVTTAQPVADEVPKVVPTTNAVEVKSPADNVQLKEVSPAKVEASQANDSPVDKVVESERRLNPIPEAKTAAQEATESTVKKVSLPQIEAASSPSFYQDSYRPPVAPLHVALPRNEEFEDEYVDTSDPHDPKLVNIRKKVKSKVWPDGFTHEHHESETASSLNGDGHHQSRTSSSVHSSSSGTSSSFSSAVATGDGQTFTATRLGDNPPQFTFGSTDANTHATRPNKKRKHSNIRNSQRQYSRFNGQQMPFLPLQPLAPMPLMPYGAVPLAWPNFYPPNFPGAQPGRGVFAQAGPAGAFANAYAGYPMIPDDPYAVNNRKRRQAKRHSKQHKRNAKAAHKRAKANQNLDW